MKPRVVYVAGSIVAAALLIFAFWHATQKPKDAATQAAAANAPAPSAGAAPATSTEDPNAAAPRIEVDDLLTHFKAGDVTIIDVRDADSFVAAHIPGALHIPLARIEGEVPYLPKGKPIVTYCT